MKVLSEGVYNYVCSELENIAGNYFEIGVFNGTGFARVARSFPDKKCYALDPFIEDGHTVASSGMPTGSNLSNQKQNFLDNTKNLDNVFLYETTSYEFEKNLTHEHAQQLLIGMVVIDGNHHYDNVKIDFEIALKLLSNKSGIIIVDDTDISGVRQAFDEFCSQHQSRIQDIVLPAGSIKVIKLNQL